MSEWSVCLCLSDCLSVCLSHMHSHTDTHIHIQQQQEATWTTMKTEIWYSKCKVHVGLHSECLHLLLRVRFALGPKHMYMTHEAIIIDNTELLKVTINIHICEWSNSQNMMYTILNAGSSNMYAWRDTGTQLINNTLKYFITVATEAKHLAAHTIVSTAEKIFT